MVNSVYSKSIDEGSIRLLCFSQSEEGILTGILRTFQLEKAPPFFVVSYAWGSNTHSHATIQLNGGSLPVLSSLLPFLNMVARNYEFESTQWWWIDSLCINFEDEVERAKQLTIMADIYRKANRAIIWLGQEKETDSDCTGAVEFLHHLAQINVAFNRDDDAIRENLQDPMFTTNCAAVSNLFLRPWWTRVWTLQEFVLPEHARVYCGSKSIGRGKFKSAVYSIFVCNRISNNVEHEVVPREALDRAFNRRRIHQWHTKPDSRGISLVSMLAYLGNHSATDSRDRIFSVLGLITARDRKLIGKPEYGTSIELLFSKLVRSFWEEYGNLDIICFVHLFSRFSGPSCSGVDISGPYWAPDWRSTMSFSSPVPLMVSQSACEHVGNFRPLKSTTWSAIYNAPGGMSAESNVFFSNDLRELHCDGIILDNIHGLGGLDERELRCQSYICAREGHSTIQSSECQHQRLQTETLAIDWITRIACSLVLDRQDKYLCFYAPTHYVTDFIRLCYDCLSDKSVEWSFLTWFEQNKSLRFGNCTLAELISGLPMDIDVCKSMLRRAPFCPIRRHNPLSSDLPNTFLSRFHDTVRKKARRLMVTREGIVGMAPCRAREGDVLAIVFGCNIPLVLRKVDQTSYQVIGEGYAHGFMNGEVMSLLSGGRRNTYRFRLI